MTVRAIAAAIGITSLLASAVAPVAYGSSTAAEGGKAEGWTWSSATHPAGSAAVPGGTSGAGVWLWNDVYYVPGVGHMSTLAEDRWETGATGTGMIGKVSHSTRPGPRELPDVGLIATGTARLEPRIRVSNGWGDAAISDVAHSTVARGVEVCHSGASVPTLQYGGYRCGTLYRDCERSSSTYCVVHNVNGLVYGGDSGGAVWQYDGGGGVVLLGWVRGQLNAGDGGIAADGTSRYMIFEPVWNLQNHSWTEDQTWTDWGYPTGVAENACFVTSNGCVRS